MAFDRENFNNIAIGPQCIYTYLTTDTITSNTWYAGFGTSSLPSMRVFDLIFITHVGNTGNTELLPVVVERVTTTGAYIRAAFNKTTAN